MAYVLAAKSLQGGVEGVARAADVGCALRDVTPRYASNMLAVQNVGGKSSCHDMVTSRLAARSDQ